MLPVDSWGSSALTQAAVDAMRYQCAYHSVQADAGIYTTLGCKFVASQTI